MTSAEGFSDFIDKNIVVIHPSIQSSSRRLRCGRRAEFQPKSGHHQSKKIICLTTARYCLWFELFAPLWDREITGGGALLASLFLIPESLLANPFVLKKIPLSNSFLHS